MSRKGLFTLLACLMLSSVRADETEKQPEVYIIPIKKMIEPALLYVVRRGIDEATENKVDAVILQMDTTGGRVDAAIAIVEALGRSEIPVYTFVEKEAISAGAMIALSTADIYMRPGSVIGDITPISMGMTGGVQDLPEAEKEKMTSYVAAHVRSAAEQGGHDPDLAEAMVRREIEYKVGETLISKSGTVLTLTNTEAEQPVGEDQKPLLSKGTLNSIDELLTEIGMEDAKTHTLEVTAAERLARLIQHPVIATLLLICGFGGIWLEFKTPGFGIFGIIGITGLLLLFLGHHIAGLAGWEDIIILLVGIGLLALEVFVIPGFGIAGISGILLILLSLISMMVEHVPGKWRPIEFSAEAFAPALLRMGLAFVGTFALAVIAGKFLPQTRFFNKLTLMEVSPELEQEDSLLGLEGIAHSDLRPSGTAYFEGRKLDVVTYGDYISRQTPIRVIEVHGNRIVVENISQS